MTPDKVTDVSRTIAFGSEKLAKFHLWFALALTAVGIADIVWFDNPYIPGWLVLAAGLGWAGWEFWRLHNPGKPLLVLSPAGILMRIVGVKDVLIPWPEVRGIERIEVTGINWVTPLPVNQTFEDVTAILVSNSFYDEVIHIDSAILRGPGWQFMFVPKGAVMQVALHAGLLGTTAEQLRVAIAPRWYAFRGQPRAPLPRRPAQQGWTPGMRASWVLLLVVIVLGAIGIIYRTTDRLGVWEPMRQSARERSIEDSVKRNARIEADTRKSFEEMERNFKAMDERMAKQFPFNDDKDDAKARQQAQPPDPAELKARTLAALAPAVQTPSSGHRGEIFWLALMPDGKRFLSASVDKTVKLWDLADARALRDLGRHRGIVRAAHVLPDGAHVLTAGDDGQIALRSLADGQVVHLFDLPERGGLHSVAVSRDGRRAVSVHWGGVVLIWDLETKALVRTMSGGNVRHNTVVMSADGSRAVTGGSDGMLQVWDTNSGALLRSFGGHQKQIYGLALTSDGTRVASGGGDGIVRLWELETGREVRSFTGHTDTVYGVAVSADGKRILSGSRDQSARLWDADTGKELGNFTADKTPVYAVAFTADGTILTGHHRNIRLWQPNGQALRVFAGVQ